MSYTSARGLEEGVVEYLTRLFGGSVLPETLEIENRTAYNWYIDALESIRLRTGHSERDFYLVLFSTPLKERAQLILIWTDYNNDVVDFLMNKLDVR